MAKTAHLGVAMIAGLLLAFQPWAHAAMLAGSPPVSRFRPDLDVYPENFAIAEDNDAVVYVGNNDGVLTFDGGDWHLIRLPNHQLVRSLAYDGKSRVYVGGYNELGYIARDPAGQLAYHDLTHLFGKLLNGQTFADIWTVKVTSAGILFQALQHLFLYSPSTGRVHLWRYAGRFGQIGNYKGRVFAQFRGEGLKYLDHDRWKMMPGGQALTKHIYADLALPDGGILFLITDGSWLEYRNGEVRHFAMQAGLPAASYFSDGASLADGTLALVSTDGYLYLVSPQGHLLQKVHIDSGYLSGVTPDKDGGILAIGDHAVIHVEWPSSWTVLGSAEGLAGSLGQIARWDSHWYVMTGAGVFESRRGADGLPGFKHLNWSAQEAWDLLPIDRNTALLADSYAVTEIHNGHAFRITHEHLYPRVLLRSRFNKNVIYVGTSWEVAVLVQRHGSWKLQLDRENIQPLNVTDMIEAAPHVLWLGTEDGGVHRIKLSADSSRVLSDQRMGKAEGIDYGGDLVNSAVFRMPNGDIVASTRAGEFLWKNGKFIRYDFDGIDKLHAPGHLLRFADGKNGMWAYDYSHVYHKSPSASVWHEEPVNKIRDGAAIQDLANFGSETLLVSDRAILCYEPNSESDRAASGHTMLTGVRLTRPDGTRIYLPLHAKSPVEIPQGGFSLAFSFAVPDHAMQDAVRYQGRLLGFEHHYSDWSPDNGYTYSQLAAGSYKFEVRGEDAEGHITQAQPFSFVVVPKWYASGWARAIWVLLVILIGSSGAAVIIRFRTRRLAYEKDRLEVMVTRRTSELEAANRKLETMAHLDGLTGIANRRRLDDYLEQVWAQCAERQRPLSLLVIDVDHFKDYNDEHGHLAGDRLLKRLVDILSCCLRRTEDLLARYGGEEFLAVLPGADERNALELAEQMRTEVESTSLGTTISVGVSTGQPAMGVTIATLVNEADSALYKAKSLGRNRTVRFSN